MKLQFGKFSGKEMNDIPRAYLIWLSKAETVADHVRQEAKRLLRTDGGKKKAVKVHKQPPTFRHGKFVYLPTSYPIAGLSDRIVNDESLTVQQRAEMSMAILNGRS